MPRREEQKTLAYTAEELFSVVSDVKDYRHRRTVPPAASAA
jgi:ribosome-associated toxin RatA of RatAB toxin-antitoxin module